MSKQGMYELWDGLKSVAATIEDTLTGKTVADSIKNELIKSRSLSSTPVREPIIVLEALRVANKVKACGLTEEDVDHMIRKYLQGKL